MVEDEKLQNKVFTQKDPSDLEAIANNITVVPKYERVNSSEAFANTKIKQAYISAKTQLEAALKDDASQDAVRLAVSKASLFSSLQEAYFGISETLEFAQLHQQTPFVQLSKVLEQFNALLITNSAQRQAAMMELCIWQMTEKLG
jgi:hypothetical protein